MKGEGRQRKRVRGLEKGRRKLDEDVGGNLRMGRGVAAVSVRVSVGMLRARGAAWVRMGRERERKRTERRAELIARRIIG